MKIKYQEIFRLGYCKNYAFFFIYLGHKYQCPADFPYLQRKRQKKGDLCRKSEYTKGAFRCPDGCVKTAPAQSPWCQKSSSSSDPCRVPKGNQFIQLICITNDLMQHYN